MSIVTELLHGQISEAEAVEKTGQWAQRLAHSPELVPIISAAETELARVLRDGVLPLAGTWFANIIVQGAHNVENSVDHLTASLLQHGDAEKLSQLTTEAVEQLADVIHGAVNAKLAELAASLLQARQRPPEPASRAGLDPDAPDVL